MAQPTQEEIPRWFWVHPRLRYLGDGKYEFIEAQQGEVDFRVVSDQGYESVSMTEDAARHWAERWTANRAGRSRKAEKFAVQARIAGVTDWHDAVEEA